MVKVITLPIPDRVLSPNARVNRFKKTSATRTHRTLSERETYKSMKDWGLPLGTYFVTSIELVAYWKTSRHKRDDVNLMASCKAYEDGVQDALGQDDSTWSMERPQHYISPKNPRLEIHIHIETL